MKKTHLTLLAALSFACAACETLLIHRTDRQVYNLIGERQQAAIGMTSDVSIGEETAATEITDRAYSFNPTPTAPREPAAFQMRHVREQRPPPREEAPVEEPTTDAPEMTPDIFTEELRPHVTVFGLSDALAYAMRHGRALLDAKEDLYLSALDLTLERHLWTPQFVASSQVDFTNFPDDADLDRALQTISEVAVTQRLAYGGDVTARVLHSMVREVQDEVLTGESGQAILSAQIPLLRGAGPVAYESRYQAERELIYAVRRYERFRRTFLVDIAADYFALQGLKAEVHNEFKSYESRKRESDKAEFVHRMGQSRTVFDLPRVRALFRQSEAGLVARKQGYETALDRFKVRIGMDVNTLLDVVDQDKDAEATAVDGLLPEVDARTAAKVAVQYRLDLLNSLDQIDDVRRGVLIAKNRILPDLNVTGSMTLDSDPDQLRSTNFRKERITWEAGMRFQLDDRRTEQNAYRASLVSLRRALRDHEEFEDSVRADVRRALRRVREQENIRTIQELNVAENETRLEAARAQFDLGRADNQAVVDAEVDLLNARNDLARAVSDYRIAILEFRRDTGTLWITDEGRWFEPPPSEPDAGNGRYNDDRGGA